MYQVCTPTQFGFALILYISFFSLLLSCRVSGMNLVLALCCLLLRSYYFLSRQLLECMFKKTKSDIRTWISAYFSSCAFIFSNDRAVT